MKGVLKRQIKRTIHDRIIALVDRMDQPLTNLKTKFAPVEKKASDWDNIFGLKKENENRKDVQSTETKSESGETPVIAAWTSAAFNL